MRWGWGDVSDLSGQGGVDSAEAAPGALVRTEPNVQHSGSLDSETDGEGKVETFFIQQRLETLPFPGSLIVGVGRLQSKCQNPTHHLFSRGPRSKNSICIFKQLKSASKKAYCFVTCKDDRKFKLQNLSIKFHWNTKRIIYGFSM